MSKGGFIKIAEANLNVTIEVECPNCEETINLLDLTEMTDDAWIYKQAMGDNQWGCEEFDTKIECTHCKNEFLISKINY